MNVTIKPILAKNILQIIPLLRKLNTKTPLKILENRVIEMSLLPNYECIGLYIDDTLIGISGLWYTTRHYIGKSVEPDHVIIEPEFRGQNLGKQFFKWIYNYTQKKGCEAIELNAYTNNQKSHKFYYNEGYNIYGFHFLKILRKNNEFY